MEAMRKDESMPDYLELLELSTYIYQRKAEANGRMGKWPQREKAGMTGRMVKAPNISEKQGRESETGKWPQRSRI
jgi:hypothetical protein